ncbi:MAG: hypothetical protein NTV87_15385 [Ignavibacteriae bacterium]|nr:hypothetical protein [Ignavibacteriota bacterium]
MNTKIIILFILFLAIAPFLYVQENRDSVKTMILSEGFEPELELEVSVRGFSAIAYADCFNAKVLKVNRGELADSVIIITVVAGDKDNYDIISSADENTVLIIAFIRHAEDEKYSTIYVTGFVDSRRTSWKIISIINKSKE